MSRKIVKCRICDKKVLTRSDGKLFRHCGVDQPIKDSIIADLGRKEATKKPPVEKEKTKEKDPLDEIFVEKDKDEVAEAEEIEDAESEEKKKKPKKKQESASNDSEEIPFGF